MLEVLSFTRFINIMRFGWVKFAKFVVVFLMKFRYLTFVFRITFEISVRYDSISMTKFALPRK